MEYGIPNEVGQAMLFTFGALVFGALCWFIFIRKDRTFENVWVAFAQRTGLVFTPPRPLGPMTVGVERHALTGAVNGVPIQIFGDYDSAARAAGVNGKTSFACRSQRQDGPVQIAFERKFAQGVGLQTGNPQFDATFVIESDRPEHALRVLDPTMQQALWSMPRGWGRGVIVATPGEVTVHVPEFAYDLPQLEFGMRLLMAAAYAPGPR